MSNNSKIELPYKELTLHIIDGKFYTDDNEEIDIGITFIPKTPEYGENIKVRIFKKNNKIQILTDLCGDISI